MKPVVMSSNVVILSATEMWKCEQVARARRDSKRAAGVADHTYGKPDADEGHERDLIGVLGEYAVSLYFREPMDLFIDLGGDDNVCDLVIGSLTTSVKCTRKRATPCLIFNRLEEFHQDVAVLAMREEPNVVRLLGWTTPARFRELHKRGNFGYGERVYVEAHELWHAVSLKAIAFDEWRSNQLGGQLVRGA